MAPKNTAEIDVGFPIYGLRFINNTTVLACGGGGEGANGIPNKITAVRCSFAVSDVTRRLQKFREITLPSNEDSPMCVAHGLVPSAEDLRYNIFVGCNQSTELIKSMNINNNVRKYVYTDDEHLQFLDAVQFDDSLLIESIGEYPKAIHLSVDSSVGGMMTSRIPSELFIFHPDTLELKLRFQPKSPSEIKDFHFNPSDGGATLTYVTASFIETISTQNGALVHTSASANAKAAKVLGKYFFSKVRYVNSTKLVIAAALKSGKGAAIIEYNPETKTVVREKLISSKIKGIVAIDVAASTGLIAVAGNDFSVSLLRVADLKVIKTYTKLHKFAITCLSFSPNGKKLATGSASNTLNVLSVPKKSGGFFSFLWTLIKLVFYAALAAGLAMYIQKAHESGELEQQIVLAKKYAELFYSESLIYLDIGKDYAQKYGGESWELGKKYGKIGYDLAKTKALEGAAFVKEEVEGRIAAARAKGEQTESFTKPSANFEEALSTVADIVSEYTKEIDSLTSVVGEVDTSSIISAAANQLTILTETESTASPSIGSQISEASEVSEKILMLTEETHSAPVGSHHEERIEIPQSILDSHDELVQRQIDEAQEVAEIESLIETLQTVASAGQSESMSEPSLESDRVETVHETSLFYEDAANETEGPSAREPEIILIQTPIIEDVSEPVETMVSLETSEPVQDESLVEVPRESEYVEVVTPDIIGEGRVQEVAGIPDYAKLMQEMQESLDSTEEAHSAETQSKSEETPAESTQTPEVSQPPVSSDLSALPETLEESAPSQAPEPSDVTVPSQASEPSVPSAPSEPSLQSAEVTKILHPEAAAQSVKSEVEDSEPPVETEEVFSILPIDETEPEEVFSILPVDEPEQEFSILPIDVPEQEFSILPVDVPEQEFSILPIVETTETASLGQEILKTEEASEDISADTGTPTLQETGEVVPSSSVVESEAPVVETQTNIEPRVELTIEEIQVQEAATKKDESEGGYLSHSEPQAETLVAISQESAETTAVPSPSAVQSPPDVNPPAAQEGHNHDEL